MDQLRDRQIGAGQLGDDAPAIEDESAAGDAADFLKIRGHQQNRAPALLGLEQQPIDFRLGADINTGRRLFEHKQLSIGAKPSREHDFLLVSAAQRRHRGFRNRRREY